MDCPGIDSVLFATRTLGSILEEAGNMCGTFVAEVDGTRLYLPPKGRLVDVILRETTVCRPTAFRLRSKYQQMVHLRRS